MFIRSTKTGAGPDGSDRRTVRLVENRREGSRVRQMTLLNLGRHFSVPKESWPLLCGRIRELMSGRESFAFDPLDPETEAEARRIAARLLESRGETPEAADWETVDASSARDSDGRSAGIEHAALEALKALGLPGLLAELGFGQRQRSCALAQITARMAHPGSERETFRWLRRASGAGRCWEPTSAPSAIWPFTGPPIFCCRTRGASRTVSSEPRGLCSAWSRRSPCMI